MVKPIKAFIKDKLEVLIFDSREQMGQAAYEAYQDKVISKLSKQDEVRAVFAAAHSQDDFLMLSTWMNISACLKMRLRNLAHS